MSEMLEACDKRVANAKYNTLSGRADHHGGCFEARSVEGVQCLGNI